MNMAALIMLTAADSGRRDSLSRVAATAKGVMHILYPSRVNDRHVRLMRSLLVEVVDGTGDSGGDGLLRRVVVSDPAVRRMATTCRVTDGLGGRARIRLCIKIDEGAGGVLEKPYPAETVVSRAPRT